MGYLMFDYAMAITCNHKVRPCMILECLYLKVCIRKYAITSYHPSVRNYIEASNELNDTEIKILDGIDNTTIYDMINNQT